ncbi:MAG: 2-polyprenylphenol 6-hydroxylase [Rhodospirillaceae bacterium]|nr:2-polyprenylphenol 6-hydroxylase [Rhodospirillaceae bacterium]
MPLNVWRYCRHPLGLARLNLMIRTARNLRRVVEIVRTIARHDALFLLEDSQLPLPIRFGIKFVTLRAGVLPDLADLRRGERLAKALQTLGPGFIKLGQALSVRSDLVGEEIADDLSTLQDNLPPFSCEDAKRAIEDEFDKTLEELFSSFEDTPTAAASIAQVHFAITTDDQPVAVKILRPGIERAFAQELDLLRWMAESIDRYFPKARRLRPIEVIDTLAETVAMEMDLRLEAAAGDELFANFEDDSTFKVPRMDWTRTGRRVLTSERVYGTPVDEVKILEEAGHDIEMLVANMARAFFLQVFRDGFFHADLHPGNLLVDEDGAIQAVDFGIMGRIDKQTRYYLAEMMIGFLTADYAKVAAVHIRAGYVPASESEESFAQASRAIAEPILGLPLKDISLARLLAQLFTVTERFKMQTQPQLLLLQKTMLVAEGVGRRLHPETNMWELARPLIEDWMENALSPEAKAAEAMTEAGKLIERLPALINNMSDSVTTLAQDGVKLHPDTVSAMSGRQSSTRWPWWAGAAVAVGLLIAVS